MLVDQDQVGATRLVSVGGGDIPRPIEQDRILHLASKHGSDYRTHKRWYCREYGDPLLIDPILIAVPERANPPLDLLRSLSIPKDQNCQLRLWKTVTADLIVLILKLKSGRFRSILEWRRQFRPRRAIRIGQIRRGCQIRRG
jgi:hypothetical protein